MIYLTAAVAAFLFVYLFTALIRPNGSVNTVLKFERRG